MAGKKPEEMSVEELVEAYRDEQEPLAVFEALRKRAQELELTRILFPDFAATRDEIILTIGKERDTTIHLKIDPEFGIVKIWSTDDPDHDSSEATTAQEFIKALQAKLIKALRGKRHLGGQMRAVASALPGEVEHRILDNSHERIRRPINDSSHWRLR
jgi:hypothetical protein